MTRSYAAYSHLLAKRKELEQIDDIHKWRPIINSFDNINISLTNLILKSVIQKKFLHWDEISKANLNAYKRILNWQPFMKRVYIDDVRATINDGEPGLMKALDTFLRNIIQLRCLGHFRQNVKEKLKKLGIRGDQEEVFLG